MCSKVERPTQLRVGNHNYRIFWDKKSWKKYASLTKGGSVKEELSYVVGQCHSRKNIILINGWDMSLTEEQDTLLHEVIHAIFAIYGFSEMPFSTNNNEDTEEVSIRLLSPHLLQVFADSPGLVEYLVQKEEL